MPPAETIGALLVLGLLCTATAFVLFGALVTEVGPGRATVITYVAPVVAVALGVAVLGERPGAGAVAGLLLIIAGSWLSTDGRLPPGPRRRGHGDAVAARPPSEPQPSVRGRDRLVQPASAPCARRVARPRQHAALLEREAEPQLRRGERVIEAPVA